MFLLTSQDKIIYLLRWLFRQITSYSGELLPPMMNLGNFATHLLFSNCFFNCNFFSSSSSGACTRMSESRGVSDQTHLSSRPLPVTEQPEEWVVILLSNFPSFVNHASSTLMFSDRLPRWLSVSGVGECLKWDGDRHCWDHVRSCHLIIYSVAHW